jgi:hypothetical protein
LFRTDSSPAAAGDTGPPFVAGFVFLVRRFSESRINRASAESAYCVILGRAACRAIAATVSFSVDSRRPRSMPRPRRRAQKSAPLLAQIHEIIIPHVEALGLERVEREGAHGHVRLVGQAGDLLAQPLA